jgi:hypothetical protein
MMQKIRRIGVAVIVALLLSAGIARAQMVGQCFPFYEFVINQGGTVYFIEPSLTPPLWFMGVYLYGQGFTVTCL